MPPFLFYKYGLLKTSCCINNQPAPIVWSLIIVF
jgi:hypothetical protein